MRNTQCFSIAFTIVAIVAGYAPEAIVAAPAGPLPLKKAKHAETRTPIRAINLPLVIANPGSYFLAENINFTTLNVDGITLSASNVTIDLNGFSLNGPGQAAGTAGSGIATSGSPVNIRILNGSVTKWRGSGLKLDGAANSQIVDTCVQSNGGDGLSLGDAGTVSACAASQNGEDGIKVAGSVVAHCSAGNNGDNGIESGGSSTISSCTSNFNGTNGFFVNSRTVITGCQAAQNVTNGIQAAGQCLVSGNTCSVNGAAGIHGTSPKSRFESNTVAFNVTGISITDTQNLIIRNSASGNTSAQFSINPGNFVGTIATTEAAMNTATNSNGNFEF